jgi:D-glycero-D-manno-heptose 1,7-bisphosphate phosphatase
VSCRAPILDPAAGPGRAGGGPALFLDRDGVINVDRGYVHRPEDFQLVDGAVDLCRAAAAAGHRVVVITNQAGIGRGLYSEDRFAEFTRWMMAELRARGAPLTAVYWCPHHPTAGLGDYRAACPARKPEPGMLLAARDELGVDLAASALVGDKPSDLEAGRRAGVGRLLLLGAPAAADPVPEGSLAVASLADATRVLYGPAW